MFRFTIRDVLWLMVVAGLALGWWIERGRANHLQGDNQFLREAIANSGFVPDGNYVGPILLRKTAEPNP